MHADGEGCLGVEDGLGFGVDGAVEAEDGGAGGGAVGAEGAAAGGEGRGGDRLVGEEEVVDLEAEFGGEALDERG